MANKQLLAACIKVHKPSVSCHTVVSIVEDVENLTWEWREDHLCI